MSSTAGIFAPHIGVADFIHGQPRRHGQSEADSPTRVRQKCITMKTATVRDLRNHFAEVAKWIEHGEQVEITRNGAVFATLAPAQPPKPRKVDWAARLKKFPPLGKGVSKEATEKLWSHLRD
jgi:antitoxin (DNA-binding transcriptional repressor) of toxin-antitoxin stability system